VLFRSPCCAPPAKILDFDNPVCPTLFLTEVTPKCQTLGKWWTLSVGNWEDEAVTREIGIDLEMIPSKLQRFAVFEFYTQKFLGLFDRKDIVELNIPAHGTRVLRITPWDRTSPKVLGTDIHITGGGHEILECHLCNKEVRGRISNPWQYPSTITVGFPDISGGITVACNTVGVSDEEFAVRIQ